MIKEIDYHKVGEEFKYDGRKYRVIDACDLCEMKEECKFPPTMSCNYDDREDYKSVFYIEVNIRKNLARAIVAFLAVLLLALFISTIFVMILDRDYILSMLLAVALLFVVVDVIVERKYKG